MGLLYKNREDIITSVEIKPREDSGDVIMVFSSDGGKFGTDEILDGYTLTPERLLKVLQSFDNYTEFVKRFNKIVIINIFALYFQR